MKNHELLDMIGDVKEDYVLEAGNNMVKPRFRWKTLAVCAACAALIVAAYPAFQAAHPQGVDSYSGLLDEAAGPAAAPEDAQGPGLHSYIVMEDGGGSVSTYGEYKAGAGGALPAPMPPESAVSGGSAQEGDAGPDMDGANYGGSGQDVPVEQAPYDQYNSLFENARLDQYPEWYGGAYIDYTTLGEPSKLVVCIVEGFHTPELEQQIAEWCGEGVWTYRDVKYSRGYLQTLMERLNDSEFLDVIALDKTASGCGVYEQENCIRMDWSAVPSDDALAALAQLDPEGDAIQIRVFTGRTVITDAVKGPASEPATDPVPGGAQEFPAEKTPAGEESFLPAAAETAQYDTLPFSLCGLPLAEPDAGPEGKD